MAKEVLELTEQAAIARLQTEGALSEAAVQSGESLAAQQQILEAWHHWYEKALGKVTDILLVPPSGELNNMIRKSKATIGKLYEQERKKIQE